MQHSEPTTLQDVLGVYFDPRQRSMPSATQAVIGRLESGGEVTDVCPRCEGTGLWESPQTGREAACNRCNGRGSVQSKSPGAADQSKQCMACAGKSPCSHREAWHSPFTPGLGASAGCQACNFNGYLTGLDAQPIHGQAEEPSCEMHVDAGWRVARWLRSLPYQDRLAVEAYFAPRAVAWREAGGDNLAPLLPLTRLGRAAKEAADADLAWAEGLLALSMQEARRIQAKMFANIKTLRRAAVDPPRESENSCNAA
jgi:hypothetical protein